MSRRLGSGAGGPEWVPARAVDVGAHVGAMVVDGPLDERGLREAAARDEPAGVPTAGQRVDTAMALTSHRFAFDFESRYRRPAALFGINERTTDIIVTEERMTARFGPWRISTSLDNVRTVRITGPYRFLKTAGPAHLGITDRGLTFATNSRCGVELQFRHPITGIDPFGLLKHPNLTLTAADCNGLARLLSAR